MLICVWSGEGMVIYRGIPLPRGPGPPGVPVVRSVGEVIVDGGGFDQVSVCVRPGLAAGARLHGVPGGLLTGSLDTAIL